jgi:hypothetical protein
LILSKKRKYQLMAIRHGFGRKCAKAMRKIGAQDIRTLYAGSEPAGDRVVVCSWACRDKVAEERKSAAHHLCEVHQNS